VLVEDARWHWADGTGVPPSLVLGYGSVPEPAIGRAIATLAEVVDELRAARRPRASVPSASGGRGR
jgi:hypothetical protein